MGQATPARLVRLTYEDYDKLEGERSSAIQAIEISPLHYRAAKCRPALTTDALHFGKLLHTAVLEPDAWDASVAVWTGGVRRGGAWDDFRASHEGKLLATETEADTCRRMGESVHANPLAHEILAANRCELVCQAVDSDTGLPMKCRMDSFGPAGLLDIKTCRDAWPLAFGRAIARYRYHAQMAFYLRVLSFAGELEQWPTVYLLALEKTEPFDAAVYRLTMEQLVAGEQMVKKWLAKVQACKAANEWPGIQADQRKPIDAVLPSWAMIDAEDDLELTIGGEEFEL